MEEFPGNSQRAKKPSREEPVIADKSKKIEKVIEGEVVRRKKPLGKRVKETFLGGDGPTVTEYVIGDILIPGIRDMFADIVTGGIERMLYGESRPSGRRGGGSRFGASTGRINYGSFSQPPVGRAARTEDPRPSLSRKARATHDFDEILLPNRPEAEAVLEGLFAVLDQYEQVTVSDLYELVGISGNFTDERWGWTDLRGSRVERTRNGYFVLNLPPTEQLER